MMDVEYSGQLRFASVAKARNARAAALKLGPVAHLLLTPAPDVIGIAGDTPPLTPGEPEEAALTLLARRAVSGHLTCLAVGMDVALRVRAGERRWRQIRPDRGLGIGPTVLERVRHPVPVYAAAVSRTHIALAGAVTGVDRNQDADVSVFGASDGGLLWRLSGPRRGVELVALSPDGTRVAALDQRCRVFVWSLQDGALALKTGPLAPSARSWPRWGMRFEGDNTLIVETARSVLALPPTGGAPAVVSDQPVERAPLRSLGAAYALAVGSGPGRARVTRTDGAAVDVPLDVPYAHPLWDWNVGVGRITLLPGAGRRLVVLEGRGVRVVPLPVPAALDFPVSPLVRPDRDLVAGATVVERVRHAAAVYAVAVSRAHIALAGAPTSGGRRRDADVSVFDASQGGLIVRLSGPRKGVEGVALSPDGARIAALDQRCRVFVWSLPDGALVHATAPLARSARSWTRWGIGFEADNTLVVETDRSVLAIAHSGGAPVVRAAQAVDRPPKHTLDARHVLTKGRSPGTVLVTRDDGAVAELALDIPDAHPLWRWNQGLGRAPVQAGDPLRVLMIQGSGVRVVQIPDPLGLDFLPSVKALEWVDWLERHADAIAAVDPAAAPREWRWTHRSRMAGVRLAGDVFWFDDSSGASQTRSDLLLAGQSAGPAMPDALLVQLVAVVRGGG